MASLHAARHYRWPGVIFCMSLATQARHRLRGVCACVGWGRVDRLQAPCLLGRIVFLQCLMRYWDPRCSRRSIPCATRALATGGIVTSQWGGEAPCRALRWLFSCYDILAVRSASLYNFETFESHQWIIYFAHPFHTLPCHRLSGHVRLWLWLLFPKVLYNFIAFLSCKQVTAMNLD